MSSKIQFSWKNQKGYGLSLIFFGWAIIFQIPAFLHSFLILKLNSTPNDYLLYLGIIISVTLILGSLLATIYENLFDPLVNQIINLLSLIIISLFTFYLFYLLSVPFIETLEPFLAIPRKLEISSWNKFTLSLISGIFGIFLLLWYSEKRN